jgi:hypothetical protein
MGKTYPRAVTPQEVMDLAEGDVLNATEMINALNNTLQQAYEGKTLEIIFPSGTRARTLNFVAIHFRNAGWGVSVRHEDEKFVFWVDKRSLATLEVPAAGEKINDQ